MTGYRRLVLPLALALPLAGLCLAWIWTEAGSREGTEWNVPVTGYDPRDLLRGHYVQFRYDWPAPVEGNISSWSGARASLCLIGAAPRVDRVAVLRPGRSSPGRCDAVAKPNPWSEEGADGLVRDRIYVPQRDAGDYQARLQDPRWQGIVRIRINRSGFITPQSLTFRRREQGSVREEAE